MNNQERSFFYYQKFSHLCPVSLRLGSARNSGKGSFLHCIFLFFFVTVQFDATLTALILVADVRSFSKWFSALLVSL